MYPIEPPEPKWIDWANLFYIIYYDLYRRADQTGSRNSQKFKRADCLTTLGYWGWKRSLWVVPQHSNIEHWQLQTFLSVQRPAEYHTQTWQEDYIYTCETIQGWRKTQVWQKMPQVSINWLWWLCIHDSMRHTLLSVDESTYMQYWFSMCHWVW